MIDIKNISTHCTRSEFVGTAVLDTIGLVISGIDDTLLETMNVGMKYRCLGLFSSRTGAAGQALNKAFGVPVGEAFGFMAGSPAAIGLVMADTAMKSAPLSIAKYMTPNKGTSHSNEVILAVSGDASAAKTAVLNARQTGLELLIGMGSYPEIPGIPYL